jgi:hypothetical protein
LLKSLQEFDEFTRLDATLEELKKFPKSEYGKYEDQGVVWYWTQLFDKYRDCLVAGEQNMTQNVTSGGN